MIDRRAERRRLEDRLGGGDTAGKVRGGQVSAERSSKGMS